MITRIEAYRYRCFRQLDLILDNFQVFVGPNGSGKTTLLDIPVVLGEMLNARSIFKAFFEPTASHLRPRADTPADIIFNGMGGICVLAVEAQFPESITAQLLEKQAGRLKPKAVEALRNTPSKWLTHIRYEIAFEHFNDELHIAQEFLTILPDDAARQPPWGRGPLFNIYSDNPPEQGYPVIERPRGGKVSFHPEAERRDARNEYGFPPEEPAFANVFADADRYAASLWLRELLTRKTCPYQPSPVALRTPQPRRPNPKVVSDASTLPWLARTLAESSLEGQSTIEAESDNEPAEPTAFERWERFASLALPSLQSIEPFVRPDDRHAYLRLHYRDGSMVAASGLSDGTLDVLALTILPFLTTTPALLTHEEPENGIHPKAVELILEALQSIPNSQVFVSTHSPLVLTQCQPAQIVSLRVSEGGGVVAVRGDQDPVLADWRDDVHLGTLLAAGVLG